MRCIYFNESSECNAGETYSVDGNIAKEYCRSDKFPTCMRYQEYNKRK